MSDLAIRERVAREVMGMALGYSRSVLSADSWFAEVRDADQKRVCIVHIPKTRERTVHDGVYWMPPISWSDVADELPAYETDIAAAWQVVEEMRKRGYRLRLVDNDLPTGANWDARFYKFPESVEIAYHAAPTAPLAICLAALAAVEAR